MTLSPIIFIASAKGQTYEVESNALVEILSKATENKLCEVLICKDATLEKVITIFQDTTYKGRIAIFHFIGATQDYHELLETPYSKLYPHHTQGFAKFLGHQTGLKLLFLGNGCTAKQAQQFSTQNIPLFLATERENQAQILFKKTLDFYELLGKGLSFLIAFKAAFSSISREIHTFGLEESPNSTASASRTLSPSPQNANQWSFASAIANPLYTLPPLPSRQLPPHPFPGLLHYTEEMSNCFWGRTNEIRALYDTLVHADKRLVMLYGSSGVGKSSLLLAGLLPRLHQVLQVSYVQHSGNLNGVEKLQRAIWSLTSSEEEEEGRLLIIIDELDEIDEELVDVIQGALEDEQWNNLQFLLSMRTSHYLAWKEALHKRVKPASFYLPPMLPTGVSSIFKGLSSTYQVELEKGLDKKVAKLFQGDSSSPFLPLLQVFLQGLWKMAMDEVQFRPRLNADLMAAYLATEPFKKFILEQLQDADEQAYHSGLAYNLLLEFTNIDQEQMPSVSPDFIQERFHHLEHQIPKTLHQFQVHHLLSEPAVNEEVATSELRLLHKILLIPFLKLYNLSEAPGQVATRLLENRLQHNVPLSLQELQTVREAKQTIPFPSDAMQNWLQQSEVYQNKEAKKRWILWGIKFSILLGAFAIGLYLDSPYFLFFVALLAILYPSRNGGG